MSRSYHGGRTQLDVAQPPAVKKRKDEGDKDVKKLVKETLARIERQQQKARKAKKAKKKDGKQRQAEFAPQRSDIVHAPGIVHAFYQNLLPSERPMLTRMAQTNGWFSEVHDDGVKHWFVITRPSLTIQM